MSAESATDRTERHTDTQTHGVPRPGGSPNTPKPQGAAIKQTLFSCKLTDDATAGTRVGAGLRDTFTTFPCHSTSPENLLWASPVSLALAVSVTFPRRRKQGRYGSGLEQPPEADSGAAGPRSRRESGKNRIETRFPGLRQPEEIVPPPPGRGTPPAGHRLELRRRAEPRGWRWRDGEARRSSFTRLEHENNKIRNQSPAQLLHSGGADFSGLQKDARMISVHENLFQ